jgi:uncharacterized protein
MSKPKPFLRVFTEPGPLVALAVAIALLIGIVGPASAQFFNFGGPPRPAHRSQGGWFGSDFFAPFQQPPRHPPRQDYSRAPAPAKRETVPERNILVLGDAMADWLAYGLEEAYIEQPEMGVIRKGKTVSGLIKYQPRGEPADWPAAAKGILAEEKPDAIVVMLGLHDRISIHEPVAEKKNDKKTDKEKKDDKKKKDARAKPADSKSKPDGSAGANQDEKAADAESSDDAAEGETPQIIAPEKPARSPNGHYRFRDERWVELYSKKIEEMIGVLKSKGVPVLWVGLPAVRGTKATADMLFLDALYRDAAGKAGITYVDVWDGFVDEAGRFLHKGPDFEGQIRQLRSYDGIYFTKHGARKLAHYVEREINRLLAARGPIALPTEPATPDAHAEPGKPAPRPLAGPILPLEASSVGTDQLLGGPGTRPAAVDALAARTLVKGDFSWPRREIAREPVRSDPPVATAAPAGKVSATPPAPKQLLLPRHPQSTPQVSQQPPPPKRQVRPAQNGVPSLRELFGFGPPRQAAPPPRAPRPPGNVGRSAAVPPRNVAR